MTLYHLSQHFSSNIFSNIQLSKRIQKADKFIYYRDIPKNKLVSLLKFVRIFPFPMHNCKQAKKCELPILKFASKYFYNIAKNKKRLPIRTTSFLLLIQIKIIINFPLRYKGRITCPFDSFGFKETSIDMFSKSRSDNFIFSQSFQSVVKG